MDSFPDMPSRKLSSQSSPSSFPKPGLAPVLRDLNFLQFLVEAESLRPYLLFQGRSLHLDGMEPRSQTAKGQRRTVPCPWLYGAKR